MGYRSGAELIKTLDECQTTGDLRSICLDFCRSYRFDDFLLCIKARTVTARSHKTLISGSDRGRSVFAEGETESVVDSVLKYCDDRVTPCVPGNGGEGNGRHMAGLQQTGLRHTLCLPVHCPNKVSTVLVLMRQLHDPPSEHLLPWMCSFALHLNEAVQRVLSSDLVFRDPVNLTEREHECLLWSAEGMTIRETAALLGIAERTVIYHLQNAVRKLQAVNRCQAVARAVAIGLVLPRFR